MDSRRGPFPFDLGSNARKVVSENKTAAREKGKIRLRNWFAKKSFSLVSRSWDEHHWSELLLFSDGL